LPAGLAKKLEFQSAKSGPFTVAILMIPSDLDVAEHGGLPSPVMMADVTTCVGVRSKTSHRAPGTRLAAGRPVDSFCL
jgi:hypothetical protein